MSDTDALSLRVEAAPRLRHLVAERIREAISNNRFKPGTRLIERELCEMIGVSRTSVREALRELESEGLITTGGGKPVVAVMSRVQIRDIYQVRVVLESLAARLCARNATEAQLDQLAANAAELERVYNDFEPAQFLRVKSAFYESLFEGAGNEVAASMLRTIHTKVSLLRATSLSVPERQSKSIEEIKAMLAAIQSRDEDEAARLSFVHIENASHAALAALVDINSSEAA